MCGNDEETLIEKNGEWSWNNAIRMAKCPNMYNGALLTCWD